LFLGGRATQTAMIVMRGGYKLFWLRCLKFNLKFLLYKAGFAYVIKGVE